MAQPIFREQALERLSSPEQLDQVMQVTPLRGWLALLALAAVVAVAVAWGVFGTIPVQIGAQGLLLGGEGIRRVLAPGDGVVTQHRRGGDLVKQGEVVVQLQDATGKAVDVASQYDGLVVEAYVHVGSTVHAGTPLLNVEPRASDLGAVLFVAVDNGKAVQPGMPVHLSPVTASADQFGVLLGQVVYVSPFPASNLRLQSLLENADLVQYVSKDGPVYEVSVQLNRDPSTPSGFQWSSHGGPPFTLSAGTLASADVVLGEQRPLGLVLPVFD
jgi:hypothetical protein